MRIHTDISRVAISVAPSPATSGTSLGVTDANAAYLPDTYPYWAVLVPVNVAPTRANSEIVKVTGGSSSGGTTTLTIVRAQGIPVTTAQSVTTSFDIYDANSVEALPQVSSDVTETPSGSVNSSNTSFTLTTAPATGTLKLYQNGVRLKLTEDYTLSGSTITMNTAPTTGDILLADYNIIAGSYSVGSTSFVYNEVPSGLVNGSNTAFDTASTYVAGTIQVYRDGQLMTGGGADYTETDSNTITFTTAPVTGSVILCTYQSAVSTAGNADTLDGYHANATPTANNIPVLDANAKLPFSASPTSVRCRVYKSSAQSINNTSETVLSFDSEEYDINTFHDNSTNNSRITIPSGQDGTYLIISNITFGNNATGGVRTKILKNGTDTYASDYAKNIASIGPVVCAMAVMPLVAGNYIETSVYQDSGGALNVLSGQYGENSTMTVIRLF